MGTYPPSRQGALLNLAFSPWPESQEPLGVEVMKVRSITTQNVVRERSQFGDEF